MVLLVASIGLTKLLNQVFSSHKLALEAVNHRIPLDMLRLSATPTTTTPTPLYCSEAGKLLKYQTCYQQPGLL
jgi:hypothetical protein